MDNFSWDSVQLHSDKFLADGLKKLISNHPVDSSHITGDSFGNYVISLDSEPYYIGEAKEISKRIKQQFKPTISTFHTSLIKHGFNINGSHSVSS